MDTDLLKTFLEINRTRHFGKAAENLFISQSAVSARIKLLEEKLGVPLFSRNRNDLQLTSAGKKFLKPAQGILDVWGRIRQEIAVEDDGKTPISVGAMSSLWDIILIKWLSSVYEHIKDVTLNVEVHSLDALRLKILDKTLDLAFMFEAPQAVDLEVTEIAQIPLCLVSSDSSASLEQAVTENYILVDWGTSFSITHARQFPESVPEMRAGVGRIALEYLVENGGSAYLAWPMVEKYLLEGQLYVVEDAPVIERSAYAVYSTQTDKQELLSRCLALMPKFKKHFW